MAAPPSCTKCKFGGAEEGDSWCLGCRALEAAQSTLKIRWWSGGHRRAAEDILFDAARQVRALKQLDQASQSLHDSLQAKIKKATGQRHQQAPGQRSTGSGTVPKTEVPEPSEPPRAERVPLPASGPPSPAEGDSSEDYGLESEQEDKERVFEHSSIAAKARPPRPPSPPRKNREVSASSGHRDEPRGERSDKPRRTTRPGHRGGARHQKKYREFSEPLRVSHKKLKQEDFTARARQRAGLEDIP